MKVIQCKVRRCGRRVKGKLYLVSGETTSPDGILPRFIRINPPLPYTGPRHRSPIVVDGDKLLRGEPYEDCLSNSSKDRFDKQAGMAWELENFGMSAAQRMQLGECKECSSVDEALAVLVGRVHPNSAIIGVARELARRDIHTTPRAAQAYSQLVRSIQSGNAIPNLIRTQACLWQLAEDLPKGKRFRYIRTLALGLSVLNLKADANAMRSKYLIEKTISKC